MSNHMLKEEKNQILMSSKDNAIVIFCDEQSNRSTFNLIQAWL